MNVIEKIGFVGIGNMGSSHAKNLYDGLIENAELVAVCDINEEKAKACAEANGVPYFLNYKDILLYN